MFEPGQKVICVDDTVTDPRIRALYEEWPVQGRVYTVRDIVPGIQVDRNHTVTVYLVELRNPVSHMGHERGFGVWRFDTLEEEDVEEVESTGKEMEVAA